MSASLVGSEMCIRDSYRPPGPPEAVPPARPPAPGGGVWWATAPPGETRGCLLYTSDAADDM
eukprot:6383715-Alexandrium_andersonii.AAC.1